ncbi:MAG TPA: hypothetical protein DEU95_08330 [Chloroflexi bacterium]|nr:hypothetical protein [Chloroflexota bacterium]
MILVATNSRVRPCERALKRGNRAAIGSIQHRVDETVELGRRIACVGRRPCRTETQLSRAVDSLDFVTITGHSFVDPGDFVREAGDFGWLQQVALEGDYQTVAGGAVDDEG